MNKLVKFLIFAVFFSVLSFVTAKLFFEPQLEFLLKKLDFSNLRVSQQSQEIVIGVAEPMTSFDPVSNNSANRERLFNIYEGLARVDKNLNVLPSLAVSYGAVNDLEWEFKLRSGVIFHNGKTFLADDAIFSIERAWKNEKSEISDLFAVFESVEKIDDFRIVVKTKIPEPLMLQKIANVMIVPAGMSDEELADAPMGTGPYGYVSSSGGDLRLRVFENYWGKKPVFLEAVYRTLESRQSRKDAFETGSVGVLSDFPPDFFDSRESDVMKILTAPTLESNFLLFGVNGPFENKNLRKAVSLSIDRAEVAKLGFGFAKPATQFAPSGIFGNDPLIDFPETDAKEALNMVSEETAGAGVSVSMYLPKGLYALGDFLKERLRLSGINVNVVFLDQDGLLQKVKDADADLIFLGWRMELGDTSEFLTAVIHTRAGEYGAFNAGGFSNNEIDELIEESQNTLKPLDRLKKLRRIMRKITEDDMVGIPLFSPEALYGVAQNIGFSPRMDGYVFAYEIFTE